MNITIERAGPGYALEMHLRVPVPIDRVFEFFADARNLEKLTPPALRFEVLTPEPILMRQGLLLDYRLRLHGFPFYWQSEITVWDPPRRFEDSQRRGPYRWWVHEHSFVEDNGGTLMSDKVHYGVPGGALVHSLFVARELRNIFGYRAVKFRDLLGASKV